jgi:hypothetical protein
MNKFLTAIFTFLMLFSFSSIIAQHQCGTSDQTQHQMLEQLSQNRINAAIQEGAISRDVTVYVPIKFHIVSKSDGTSGISESQILGLLCEINNKYADQEMVFYINYPYNYISNDALFNDPGSNGGLFQIQQNWANNSLNLFIVKETGNPGSGGYYQAGFPGFPYEHIIMKKSQFDGATANHEIGHFFTLAHPFLGWGQGSEPGWDPDVHGNPVGIWSPDGPPFMNEKMDQSNCLDAADKICDTPPDYLFANSPGQSGCVWNGGAMDPDGVIVDPMENNIMSYFNGCGTQIFSPDQKDAIRNSYNSTAKAYIRHSYVPPTGDITEAPELIEPIDNEVTPGFNIVFFDWEAPAEGAQRYFLEIDQQPTFAFLPKRYVIGNGSSTEIEGVFNPNVTYYWRVTPYNDGNTCNIPTSTVGVFKTGESVSTKNIEFVNNWSVMPNPVRYNETLNIKVEAAEAFDADIRLFSLTGQLVKNVSKLRFNNGENSYNLDISGVNTGMYIVAVQSEKGVINKKIVITD